jgi:hypothetical protein
MARTAAQADAPETAAREPAFSSSDRCAAPRRCLFGRFHRLAQESAVAKSLLQNH